MTHPTTYQTWPRWMQKQTAAAYCDMSSSYFQTLVNDGVLPKETFRSGRTARWDRKLIDEKLDAMTLPVATSNKFAQRI